MGNFACFLSSADFYPKKKIKNTCIIRVSNSLDPHQARRFVVPDLGPNCLEILSADDTCRQTLNEDGISANSDMLLTR